MRKLTVKDMLWIESIAKIQDIILKSEKHITMRHIYQLDYVKI